MKKNSNNLLKITIVSVVCIILIVVICDILKGNDMAIEKKLIHFGKLADFEAQLTAGNILDYSIVFIQDAKKIWTRGTYYDCSGITQDYVDNAIANAITTTLNTVV